MQNLELRLLQLMNHKEPFAKAELVLAGGIADDDDDDDVATSFICHSAVKRSNRQRSHGSRSRRLRSATTASHAVGQNHRSLLQAEAPC